MMVFPTCSPRKVNQTRQAQDGHSPQAGMNNAWRSSQKVTDTGCQFSEDTSWENSIAGYLRHGRRCILGECCDLTSSLQLEIIWWALE